jgi:hypothetical protein
MDTLELDSGTTSPPERSAAMDEDGVNNVRNTRAAMSILSESEEVQGMGNSATKTQLQLARCNQAGFDPSVGGFHDEYGTFHNDQDPCLPNAHQAVKYA